MRTYHAIKMDECEREDSINELLETVSKKNKKIIDRSRYNHEYYQKHKLENRSRKLFRYHIKAGNVKESNICEECGSMKYIEAHHPDYSKPLDVIWMCKKCHKRIHKEIT